MPRPTDPAAIATRHPGLRCTRTPSRGCAWACDWTTRAAALIVVAAGLACQPSPPDDRLVLRAGDSLLDHIDQAWLLAEPHSVLPTALQERAGHTVRWLQAPLTPGSWGLVHEIPAPLVGPLAARPEFTLWATQLVDLPRGASGPTLSIDGTPVTWHPGDGPLPGPTVWWDAERSVAFAAGRVKPDSVGVLLSVPPGEVFGPWETASPAATGLAAAVTRYDLADVSRPGLLLPPGGAVAWAVDELRATRLHLALGLDPRSWQAKGDALAAAPARSDGATFLVELGPPPGRDGALQTVFSHTIAAADLALGYHQAVIDLSPWQGRAFTLVLRTDAGPAGHAAFDYPVWADLTLRGAPERTPERPHVVLIDMDTLRADRLGVYGSSAGLTPRIDAWAEQQAVVFTDAVSPASWTLPATVSMLTGLAVHQHGVDRQSEALPAAVPNLASRLGDAGYETMAWTAGGYVRARHGFDQGFDAFTIWPRQNLAWDSIDAFLASRDSERPLFLFLQTYATHSPYRHDPSHADPAYDGRLAGQDIDRLNVFDPWIAGQLPLAADDRAYIVSMYDALVAGMDSSLGELLELLAERLGDDTLIVFTSDHGEAFLEHGLLGHGQALYDELLRVPLIIRAPDGKPGRRQQPADLTDIVPTVLDLVGLPPVPGLPGRSLWQPANGERIRVGEHDGLLRSVRSAGLKLIEERDRDRPGVVVTTQVFDLTADPGEQRNLAQERPDDLETLRRRGAWYLATYPAAGPAEGAGALDDAAAEDLAALGYLEDG